MFAVILVGSTYFIGTSIIQNINLDGEQNKKDLPVEPPDDYTSEQKAIWYISRKSSYHPNATDRRIKSLVSILYRGNHQKFIQYEIAGWCCGPRATVSLENNRIATFYTERVWMHKEQEYYLTFVIEVRVRVPKSEEFLATNACSFRGKLDTQHFERFVSLNQSGELIAARTTKTYKENTCYPYKVWDFFIDHSNKSSEIRDKYLKDLKYYSDGQEKVLREVASIFKPTP